MALKKKNNPGPTATKLLTEDSAAVENFISRLEPGLQEAVQLLREVIKAASPLVGEHIKWNNPAFFYKGEMKPFDPKEYKRDIVVMNLHKGRIMLVFPNGKIVNDESGLLTGEYKDGRRIATFTGLENIKKEKPVLVKVIRKWISLAG